MTAERAQMRGMQQTIHELTRAIMQATQGGRNRGGTGELHRNFRSLNPPRFSGSTDLDEAEHWLKKTERIFYVMQCAAGDKLLLATFQLEKDTRAWSLTMAEYEAQFSRLACYAAHLVNSERMKAKHFLSGLMPQYITQLAPLDIKTYAEMVKKAQLLEDATDFTDRIKGKFVKKELTSGQSSSRPNNGKKRPLNLTEGPSQERKPKAIVPYNPAKSNCKHCDKSGHTTDEYWRKVGACETEDELYTQEDGNDQE
ncbi:hypothetical protein Taro_003676 [Colocasia esculenta]|uniref:Gag protein n=1 Tax=Colocasia esculenta TaxID=4460 RepID=A0A843TG44_COLES|nr:hypothetical protein [Colocasia esculenta]